MKTTIDSDQCRACLRWHGEHRYDCSVLHANRIAAARDAVACDAAAVRSIATSAIERKRLDADAARRLAEDGVGWARVVASREHLRPGEALD